MTSREIEETEDEKWSSSFEAVSRRATPKALWREANSGVNER